MSDPTISEAVQPSLRAGDLVTLHEQRTPEELRAQMAAALTHLMPDGNAIIRLIRDEGWRSIELAHGPECAVSAGDVLESQIDPGPNDHAFPLRFGGAELGELVVHGAVGEQQTTELETLISHYVVALVNLTLNADVLQSSTQYYASLQAFEEGVGLFKEAKPEAVSARFLNLLHSVLSTSFGALFLLEEHGQIDSPLRLESALGIPEAMLQELRLPDGSWWPPTTLELAPQALARRPGEELPGLDNERLPDALSSVVTCPLHFEGVVVGIGLAFNCDTFSPGFDAKLERLRSLGTLGAAIFHRLRLEREAVRSREVETQLTIASQIQAGLVPAEAPKSEGVECAWLSRAAQKIGGDYVDLIADESGELCAVIADVAGHGINSALMMTSFRATYRAECFRRDCGDLLGKLNQEIANEAGDTGMFVTAATFRIKAGGRSATYASAGHNDIYVYRAATEQIDVLESTGPSTGFFPFSEYDTGEVDLAPGDVLLLYTDGLVEATAPGSEDQMFGDDRTKELLAAHAESSPREILEALRRELEAFGGTDTFEDDVSISVIKAV